MTSAINYNPKTKPVLAGALRKGDIVLESEGHPARITRISYSGGRVNVHARYVWQREREWDWLLGRFHPDARIEKAVR